MSDTRNLSESMLASMVKPVGPVGASFCSVRSVDAVIIVIMEACTAGFLMSFRTDDRFGVLVYVCVSLAVVMSVQTIGSILVLALLVTPAATARLLSDRIATMMTLAALIGSLAAIFGVYISWSFDYPTGATIVMLLTLSFVTAWLFAPRHGYVTSRILHKR